MSDNLNFTCRVGNLICARSRALRLYKINFTPDSYSSDFNCLGGGTYFNWSDCTDESTTVALVVDAIKFPKDANSLDYLVVLLDDGDLAMLFDNPKNGFWYPFEETTHDPKVMSAHSVRVWIKPRPLSTLRGFSARTPCARKR